jgi:hypothetical protein
VNPGYNARAFAAQSDIPLRHERRVLPLDGVPLRVPNAPEYMAYFGGMHTSCGKFPPVARASAILDIARGALVNATMGAFSKTNAPP